MNPDGEGSVVYAKKNYSSLLDPDSMQSQASDMCPQGTPE